MSRLVRALFASLLFLGAVAGPLLGIAWLSPFLLLSALLLFSPRSVERVALGAASRRPRPCRHRRATSASGRPRAPRASGPRGSALLAFNLATRPPPLLATH